MAKHIELILLRQTGLSYTNFSIKWSSASSAELSLPTGGGVTHTLEATVTNTGNRAGDEVVMAFMKPDKVTMSGSVPCYLCASQRAWGANANDIRSG